MTDNYFDFYGLPVAFFPDEKIIRQKYYANSRQFHPDFYTMEEDNIQQEMLEKSSLNNKAYQTLSSFEKRIPYILALYIDLEKENQLDPEFLMEMMDLNERREDAMSVNDVQVIHELKEECRQLLQTMDNNIHSVMVAFDKHGPDTSRLMQIRDYYHKRKYILRIQENISTFAGL